MRPCGRPKNYDIPQNPDNLCRTCFIWKFDHQHPENEEELSDIEISSSTVSTTGLHATNTLPPQVSSSTSSRLPPPLDPATQALLDAFRDSSWICSICQYRDEPNHPPPLSISDLRTTSICRHVFHSSCLALHLFQSTNPRCPNCRGEL